MTTKPSIVLVHGFWGGAAHWSKVIIQLSKMGYASINAVENPLTSLADAAALRRRRPRPWWLWRLYGPWWWWRLARQALGNGCAFFWSRMTMTCSAF